MDEKLSIRVNIIDRYYPLKIDRGDEEKIRKAGKIINDKVLQYKQKYSDKDVQDFLAMAALQYVTRLMELEDNQDSSTLAESIKELNEELEIYFKEEV
jgi:cell division protein ZapA (FtsZ GTPase activity inhibitor)